MLDFWIHDFVNPYLSVERTEEYYVDDDQRVMPNNEKVVEENKEGAAAE